MIPQKVPWIIAYTSESPDSLEGCTSIFQNFDLPALLNAMRFADLGIFVQGRSLGYASKAAIF